MKNIHHSDISICQFHVHCQAALRISDYATFQIGHKLHLTRPVSLAALAAHVMPLIFAPKHNHNCNSYNYSEFILRF